MTLEKSVYKKFKTLTRIEILVGMIILSDQNDELCFVRLYNDGRIYSSGSFDYQLRLDTFVFPAGTVESILHNILKDKYLNNI